MTTPPTPTLPVLSLDELRHGRQRETLHTHARELGVFYLRDYGMSDDDHRPAMAETQDLFATITAEERVALTTKIASIRRGYSGLEAESTAIVTNNGDYTDYSMTYSMGLSHNLFPSPCTTASRSKRCWTATR
jgi:isopenicillin N synthase-like dioxygenase